MANPVVSQEDALFAGVPPGIGEPSMNVACGEDTRPLHVRSECAYDEVVPPPHAIAPDQSGARHADRPRSLDHGRRGGPSRDARALAYRACDARVMKDGRRGDRRISDAQRRGRARRDRIRRRIGRGRPAGLGAPNGRVRLKLDENLPALLVPVLAARGHDADTVRDEGLTGASDARVFAAAQSERRLFMTQDLDFADARRFVPGTHRGVLIRRLANPGAGALSERLLQLLEREAVSEWVGCVA